MKMSVKTSATSFIAAAALLGGIGAAMAAVSIGDTFGTSEEEVRAVLSEQGYTVEEFEAEKGEFEVEAILVGREMEIVIDATSGIVLEVEMDDDDDSDDEKDDN